MASELLMPTNQFYGLEPTTTQLKAALLTNWLPRRGSGGFEPSVQDLKSC